jgi:hypothetical protein
MLVAFGSYLPWRRHPYGIEVGLLRHSPGAVVDGYEEADSWLAAIPVPGCALAPGDVVEDFEANREGVGVEFTLYMPPGSTVNARDRIQLPGHTDPFEVVGPGKDWGRNPFTGRASGVVVQLGRFDG